MVVCGGVHAVGEVGEGFRQITDIDLMPHGGIE